ncbi:MAG: hypothetical protein IH624_02415 [Phycisphaerae bacterium]|nr:hypothetical protein [Phycisphaerae bacterium]
MSFIKKYSVLLIPVGIVLVAVVFILLTVLTSRSLAGDIQKNSVAAAAQIDRLLSNAVPAEQWQEEKIKQDALEADATGVEQLARQCSMRELISYRIFPKPLDKSQQVFDEYAARYRAAIEQMVRGMKAMEAPSEMEIRDEIGESSGARSAYAANAYSRSPSASRPGQGDTARQAMIDAVCARRAEQIAVYANPTVFKWYEYWGDFKFPGEDLAVTDCWNSQLAYWIYEDVAASINGLNAGSANVYASPVKRLLGVTFSQEAGYPEARGAYTGARGYGRGDYGESYSGAMRGDAPEYIRVAEGGQLGVAAWTARICNEDIDVVHFSVAVITASSAVMPFMKELCSAKAHTWRAGLINENGAPQTGQHNQITILKSEVIPVDPLAAENASYRYGDEAVVRLNLVCEYLFSRPGYDDAKPAKIKEHLGHVEGAQQMGGMESYGGRTSAPSGSRGRSSGRPSMGDDL